MNTNTDSLEQTEKVSQDRSEGADGSANETETTTEKRHGRKPGQKTPKERLSSEEATALKASEQTVSQNLRGGWELAKALAEICEKRLYRGQFRSFKTYCQKRWKLSHRHVRHLIAAVAVRERLANTAGVSSIPETECQVRSLTRLTDESLQAKAWVQACEAAGEQPTGSQVRKAVDALAPKPSRSSEQKAADLLRGLKALSKAAVGVNSPIVGFLKQALECLTAPQEPQEVKPRRGRRARA